VFGIKTYNLTNCPRGATAHL